MCASVSRSACVCVSLCVYIVCAESLIKWKCIHVDNLMELATAMAFDDIKIIVSRFITSARGLPRPLYAKLPLLFVFRLFVSFFLFFYSLPNSKEKLLIIVRAICASNQK